MKKKDLIVAIRNTCKENVFSISLASVDAVLAALATTCVRTLAAGGEVNLPGVGTLKTKGRKARYGRNPRTGETVAIPAKIVPQFVPARALKDAMQ